MKNIKSLFKNPLAPLAMTAALLAAYPALAQPVAASAPSVAAATADAAAAQPAKDAAPRCVPCEHAATPTPPQPSQPSLWQDATSNATHELRAALGADTGVPRLLDLFPFQFSPATAQKLFKVFGTDQPMSVERVPSAKGGIDYLLSLQALNFDDLNGMHLEWTPATAKVSADKARRNVSMSARWPSIGMATRDMQLSYSDLSYEARQNSPDGKLWFGTSGGRIGKFSMGFTPPAPPSGRPGVPDAPVLPATRGVGPGAVGPDGVGPDAPPPAVVAEAPKRVTVDMDEILFKGAVLRRGQAADLGFSTSIKSVNVEKERVEHVNMAARLLNLDLKTLRDFTDAFDKLGADPLMSVHAPEQQAAAMMALISTYGKQALLRGASLAIDDISASYHGNKASISGRIGFAKLVEGDFSNAKVLFKKLDARFEVRVPLALLDDVASATKRARKGVGAETDSAASSKGESEELLKAALMQGWVRIENGEARSTIIVKNARLTINGKEMPIPGITPPAAAAAAAGAKPAAKPAPARK